MLDEGRLDQGIRGFRIAADKLNKVGVVSADGQALLNGLNKPAGRPDDILGALQDNSVASKDSRNNG